MKKYSIEEAKDLPFETKDEYRNNAVLKELDTLLIGEALFVANNEWPLVTNPSVCVSAFFLKREGLKTFKVKKIETGYYIKRLT